MVPHADALFASADEASAALLETDAARAAFEALAQANATPGTGIKLTPAELSERVASHTRVCEVLIGQSGPLIVVDSARRMSLAVDIPAVAYMPASALRGMPRRRSGPLVLAVPSVLRRAPKPLTPAGVAEGLRKAFPQLAELSDAAWWVTAAGVLALPSPRRGLWEATASIRCRAAVEARAGTAEYAAGPTPTHGVAAATATALPAGEAAQSDDTAADTAAEPPREALTLAAPAADKVSLGGQCEVESAVGEPTFSAGTPLQTVSQARRTLEMLSTSSVVQGASLLPVLQLADRQMPSLACYREGVPGSQMCCHERIISRPRNGVTEQSRHAHVETRSYN